MHCLQGNLLESNSLPNRILMDIRKRKGMSDQLPVFTDYHDNISNN